MFQKKKPPPISPEFPSVSMDRRQDENNNRGVGKRTHSGTLGRLPAGPVVSDPPESAERWFHQAHSFVCSLSVHVLVLLVLALCIIQQPHAERLRLDLTFGETPGVGESAEALSIQPQDDTPDDSEPAEETQPETEMVVETKPDPPEETMVPPVVNEVSVIPFEPVTPAAPETIADITVVPSVRMSLSGRADGRRQNLLESGGGGDETEMAVALALQWLIKQQEKTGLWSLRGPYLDGSRQENRLAATAMALLALQGAGNIPTQGIYQSEVKQAWKAVLMRQLNDGTFDLGPINEQQSMYSHAQITIALCELSGMTQDARVQAAAQKAVAYCIASQMPDGGWKYHPPQPNHPNRGDMSVTGWYMMALKSAEMASLNVPQETYEQLESFLDRVFVSDQKGYGYEIIENQNPNNFQVRLALTAEALLCRLYLGWQPDNRQLGAGVDLLFREVPRDFQYPDVYSWYYVTQVCRHMEGPHWNEWNTWMKTTLPAAQVHKGRETGSWNPSHDKWGYMAGRLFMTSLCTCMLESYYRHIPLFSAEKGIKR